MTRAPRAPLPLTCALGAALLLASATARAGSPRVLFITPSRSPFSIRVRAEIEAMGFAITESDALLDEGSGALAAARVINGATRRVELWIADPTTGHLIPRSVVIAPATGDEDSQTAQVSEQLRAFFEPIATAPAPRSAPALPVRPPPALGDSPGSPVSPSPPPHPPGSPTAPSSTVNAISSAATTPTALPLPESLPRPRFLLGGDLGVTFQPGGPALDLGLRGRWLPTTHLGLGAFLTVPLRGSTISGPEGSSSLSVALFGLDVAASITPIRALRLTGSAGLALAWARTGGSASAPYQGRASDVALPVPLLGATIAPRLTRAVSLSLDGLLGASLSRADIVFAGRTTATWGRPLARLALGVHLDW